MDSSGGRPSPKASQRTNDLAHRYFMQASSICFLMYRNLLAGPARLVVPEHTRDAFFQLFCDLRTNTPKDRKWLNKHARALKPKTLPGWLALGSSLMFATAASGLLVFTSTLALVAALYSLMAVFALGVVLVGAGLSMLAVAMLALACTSGFVATAVAWGYVALSTPGALVAGYRRLQGRSSTSSSGAVKQPSSPKSLAYPGNSTPAPSSSESTGVGMSDHSRLGGADPSAASQRYVEHLQTGPMVSNGISGTASSRLAE